MTRERKAPHLQTRELSAAELWAERIVLEAVRRMDPCERLERMEDLNRSAREVAMCGLRMRYPDANEGELKLREASLRLGRETMVRFFGWDPDIQGW